MLFINTPGYYKSLSDFYYQLGTLITAGVPVLSALNHIIKNAKNRRIYRLSYCLLEGIKGGETFTETIKHSNIPVPDFDIALIEASEKSGRLEACFKILSDHYQQKAQLINQFIANLAYPVFLLHFAVFIFPFAEFFTTGNLLVYAAKTIGLLLPLYIITFVLIYAIQPYRDEHWRWIVERFIRKIPLFGTGRHSLVLSRFAFALESLLSAGVPIINAIELAAEASGSVILKGNVKLWGERLTNGITTPSEEINHCREFPEMFASQYSTGEVSGKLDDSLKRLHSYYLEEATRKLRLAFQWAGHLIFILIALAIGLKIILFYYNYYQQIGIELNQ